MRKTLLFIVLIVLLISSCKAKKINYVDYYNNTLAIDSVLRFHKDTLTVVNSYKKHFKKFKPHNQERLREFETYIYLSHKMNKDFGGKRSLFKLIDLITPYKYRYKDYSFFKKYGIDSLDVLKRIKNREEKYNKVLIDSFKTAYERDQSSRKEGYTIETKIADLKNFNLFKWTFAKYGFPSVEKVGSIDKDKWWVVNFYDIMFLHYSSLNEYDFFKENLIQYIKSGDCNPYSYAQMVDRYETEDLKNKSFYNVRGAFDDMTSSDSLRVNKNRKSIGLPSLNHTKLIPYNRLQILKLE